MTNIVFEIGRGWVREGTPRTDLVVAPYRKFMALIEDEGTMDVVAEQVVAGKSLRQIADEFGVEPLKLAGWISSDRGRLSVYEEALKSVADGLVYEALKVAKENDDVSKAKLHVDTNLKVAALWDKERFGNIQTHNVNNKTMVLIAAADASVL